MPNPNFSPEWSTNQVYMDTDTTVCLTDTLAEMETDINSKANSDHQHTGYASSAHTHTGFATETHTHNEYATTDHAHTQYANTNHEHSGYSLADHSHNEYSLTNHTHSGFASSNHTHNDYASTSHGHSYNDLSDKPTIPSAYTHPTSHPASMITGLKTVATSGSYNDLTNKPTIPTIPTSLPANGGNADTVDNKHASDFATADHTHTGFASNTHNHDGDYIKKALQFVNDAGGVEFSYGENSGKNVLTEISGMSQGFHTIYAITGTDGNPETTDSYRYLVHKTSNIIGWILAFGAQGSIYENYQSASGSFRGWRTIFSTTYKPLWTGSWYMNGTQTVTPTKKLSECEHGWILLWSDFDTENNKAVDSDFCTTMIPKRCGNANWSGQSHIALVPTNVTNTTDEFTCKRLYVHDDKFTGHNANSVTPRNDVVLRAVYEF